MNELDQFFPPAGPCLFCGGPDKRHRLWDAIDGALRELAQRGREDSAEVVAKDYDVPVEAVRAVQAAYAEARRRHKPLPGTKVPRGTAQHLACVTSNNT